LNLITTAINQLTTNDDDGITRQQRLPAMFDKVTVAIILFFLASSWFGHALLHRVIKTPPQYRRAEEVK
jgi:hypothetical protein